MDCTLLMNRPRPLIGRQTLVRARQNFSAETPSNSRLPVYVQFTSREARAGAHGLSVKPWRGHGEAGVLVLSGDTAPETITTTNERCAYIRRHLSKRGRLGDGTLYKTTA